MKVVQYTEEEIKAQIQLIDLAIKSAGFQVAEAGVILIKKLQDALKSVEAPVTPPSEDPPSKPIEG